MLDIYSGASLRRILTFAGAAGFVVAVVVLVYGQMYGFSNLGQTLVGASKVMVAAHNTTPGGGIHAPAAGNGVNPPVTDNTTGQYLCPVHGGAGLPVWGDNGGAHCPVCGRLMEFVCFTRGGGARAVAFAGGGGGG